MVVQVSLLVTDAATPREPVSLRPEYRTVTSVNARIASVTSSSNLAQPAALPADHSSRELITSADRSDNATSATKAGPSLLAGGDVAAPAARTGTNSDRGGRVRRDVSRGAADAAADAGAEAGADRAGPALTGPFCPPPTGPWHPSHGVTLAPLHKALRLYRTNEADCAMACAREGIPLDVAVPLNVAEVVDAAFRLRAWPEQAAPVWEFARALLVAAQERVAEARRAA